MQADRQEYPTHKEFQDLFINSPELKNISAYLKRFNPIKTMGMAHMEIRHSAILGWLLDPQESHGLGDQFLKSFLATALQEPAEGRDESFALAVSQSDLTDTEVRREWRSIDLLLINRTQGWVIIIENKFYSRQHSEQLKRYFKLVEDSIAKNAKLRVDGLFLALGDEEPEDPRYSSVAYESIIEKLEFIISDQVRPLAPEVNYFIEHYIEVLREKTGMDNKKKQAIELAKQLYRDHRSVIEFVMEHGSATDFQMAVDDVFGVNLDAYQEVKIAESSFIYYAQNSCIVSFLPKSWFDAWGGDDFRWHGCENWWARFPVVCWFELSPSQEKKEARLRLYAEVGPLVEYEFRKGLIEEIEAIAKSKELKDVSFQKTAKDEGKKYSKFLNLNMEEITDENNSDEISEKMGKLLKKFDPTFDALAPAMAKFIEYGKDKPYAKSTRL